MEAAGIQLSPLCPTNYLNVPSLKMSVIWSLEELSAGSLGDASQIPHFFPWSLKLDHPHCSLLDPWGASPHLASQQGGAPKARAEHSLHSQTEFYWDSAPFESILNETPWWVCADFFKKSGRRIWWKLGSESKQMWNLKTKISEMGTYTFYADYSNVT